MLTQREKSRRFVKHCLGGLTLFLLACFILAQLGYRINPTPSVPQGVWKVTPLTGPIQRGQIVSVCPTDTAIFQMARSRHYLPPWGSCPGGFIPLFKPVVAIPGDQVTVSNTGISVNGKLIANSRALPTDRQGQPMHPFTPGTYIVQPGWVWLVSSYIIRSFDSRYFGPLPIQNIQGSAKPVWIQGKI